MIETSPYKYQNKPRELASNGFAVEYDPRVTDQELRDDIISYLGEYRFALQKYDYELEFSDGAVRDTRRGEALSIKAARSVRERMMRGESISREVAEASGLNFLDHQLSSAEVGDSIVWASPPGEKSEGYGDYGFFYIGQIKRSIENRKKIQMSALRVEKPTLEGFTNAFKILTDIDPKAEKPEDFLMFPVVVKKELSEDLIIKTLNWNFPFEIDGAQKQVFDLAVISLKPRINEFIKMVRFANLAEKKTAFHALENYSLQVKKELESGIVSVFESEAGFDQFVSSYGYEPPKVAGSCPIKSNNVFSNGFEKLNGVMENDKFECPKCHSKADGPVGNQCPNCGITKEQWARQSHEVC